MNELQIESIHCDRLTITGRLDWTRQRNSAGDWQNYSHVLAKLFNPIESHIVRYPNMDNGLYSDNFTIPIQEQGSSIFIQVNKQYSSSQRDFRADFNPAKLTKKEAEWLAKILGRIKEKRATRIDMAANIHHNLKAYKLTDGRQRSSVEFKDRYGNIETLYRGSKNSDNYLKLYDKKKERASKYREVEHDWWRIEETIKDAKANTWNTYPWFNGIILATNKPIFPKEVDGKKVTVSQECEALCIMNDLRTMEEFSVNHRTRLRKIITAVTYEGGLNLQEEIKKAPYQQMLEDALKEINYFLMNAPTDQGRANF
ncbi:replication initiation factor domain-containing protein [Bacillus subtilis]|uniref:replication initiation factor domain-containing protein n=1 Tax=Bacillus subtilis TaxID=1423 RepID=UPI001E5DBF4B|nr:hypothetical protein [Bacillus subtilis]